MNVLNKIETYIIDSGIYSDFSEWLKERISVLEIELDYHKYSNKWMKINLDR